MPGKTLTNLLEEITFPTESLKFWEDPGCSPQVYTENPVGFLLPNLTALPQNCSALPGPKHTPAPLETSLPATPTEQGWLLGQVTRKQKMAIILQPELGLLFPLYKT